MLWILAYNPNSSTPPDYPTAGTYPPYGRPNFHSAENYKGIGDGLKLCIMHEEIRRILKLLEEGKISADEAERLIKALKEGRSWSLESIVRNAVRSLSKLDISRLVKEFGGERIVVSLKSDAVNVKSYGKNILIRSSDKVGEYLIKGEDVLLPEGTNVHANSMGGDIEVQGKFGKLKLNSSGGDINVDCSFKELSAKSFGGDILLRIHEPNFTLKVRTYGGIYELPEDLVKVDENTYMMGEGKVKINVDTYGGDFKLVLK